MQSQLSNGNNEIEYDAFIKYVCEYICPDSLEIVLTRICEKFDSEKKGKISMSQLKDAMDEAGEDMDEDELHIMVQECGALCDDNSVKYAIFIDAMFGN